MLNKKRFTITAALPYANGPIHIGHLAGAYVPADIYSRYLKLKGHDVIFICGSDEHGAAIPIRAKKEGISPQEIIDKYHFMIKDSFLEFGISFDNYSRTSSKIHHETASDFFKKLNKKNIFVEKESEQLYKSLPSFTPIKAYICGFALKSERYDQLSYSGSKGRKNFTVQGWNGPLSKGDLDKIKKTENISGKVSFSGIGEFSHDHGYLFNTGNLTWSKANWDNVISMI